MTFTHQVNDFLYSLFSETELLGQDSSRLAEYLPDYYTFVPYRPTGTVQYDVVTVRIDTNFKELYPSLNTGLKFAKEWEMARAIFTKGNG